jgi:nitrate reductase gamma subunit
MDILLLIALYAAYGAFLVRVTLHAMIWRRGLRDRMPDPRPLRTPPVLVWRATADLFLFARLLRSNGLLWALEWLFHVSLLLALLRHLRFVLDPVPAWVWAVQPWGLAAGYLLPVVIGLILLVRLATRREIYSSPSNLLLLAALFVVSLTGVLMHAAWKPDLVGIKEFSMGFVAFAPAAWPDGALATAHVLLFALLLPFVPSHIFSAPVTILAAARREEMLHEVLHGR